jgi:hypothetical protein
MPPAGQKPVLPPSEDDTFSEDDKAFWTPDVLEEIENKGL